MAASMPLIKTPATQSDEPNGGHVDSPAAQHFPTAPWPTSTRRGSSIMAVSTQHYDPGPQG
ncbi:hypothetical protein OG203_38885 [Nocardia sp. NBC_01499]|uniref:hypothetical protein n=1 Tax=Nocardia sp. NBC_01499 TaxID=2903597 RepID=UPI0038636945